MHLLIDLGNTRIKWTQAHAADQWDGVVEVEVAATQQWHLAFFALPRPERIVACSVGQPHIRDFLSRTAADLWQIQIEWLQVSREALGVNNRYRKLEQQGPDRWAAVLGARKLAPERAIVIASAGTALTVEAVTQEGDYLGGMILPGYRMMKQSLHAGTARLPFADGHVHDFPTSTEDAIETGCLTALAGAIIAMRQRLALRGDEPVVLVSGGDAARVATLLNTPHQLVDNLVLHGLAALAFAPSPSVPDNA
ncbi:type III pantothenate kinase [Amantichitinum ursilacus]|uniref:Type III pantothenate kinase n=1 Tax=Amantichitinum ursilacus TaxID=857265 RepID=A0A0N0GM90_9NEIS|nr:type III pantothenate kinase [Amantichitinum ursilacus]KPC50848.1 Type III pantothenate kinase [Amantichitinum ursilacus]